LLQRRRECSVGGRRCFGSRRRGQPFSKELNRGVEQLTAGNGKFFTAGGNGFGLAAEAFVKRGLGARTEQDFKAAAKFFHAALKLHLIHVAFRVEGGKGQNVLFRKRAQQFLFDCPLGDG
jgi:hypothetical protein